MRSTSSWLCFSRPPPARSSDSFAEAANLPPGQDKLRELNLRLAYEGCKVAADLVKTLGNHGHGKVPAGEKVTVGKVNVEAGGQAIVGNVESAPPSGGSPTKHPRPLIAWLLSHTCPARILAIGGQCLAAHAAEQKRARGEAARHPPSPERSAAACMVGQKVLVLLRATAMR